MKNRWEHDPLDLTELKSRKTSDSKKVIRQVVHKLEEHCHTSFSLNRAFKFFDKDMSNSIDNGRDADCSYHRFH